MKLPRVSRRLMWGMAIVLGLGCGCDRTYPRSRQEVPPQKGINSQPGTEVTSPNGDDAPWREERYSIRVLDGNWSFPKKHD